MDLFQKRIKTESNIFSWDFILFIWFGSNSNAINFIDFIRFVLQYINKSQRFYCEKQYITLEEKFPIDIWALVWSSGVLYAFEIAFESIVSIFILTITAKTAYSNQDLTG